MSFRPILVVLALAAVAADAPVRFFTAPLTSLEITDGQLPPVEILASLRDLVAKVSLPVDPVVGRGSRFKVRLEGPGEVELIRERRPGDHSWDTVFMAVRTTAEGPVSGVGVWFLPDREKQGGTFRFRLPANANTSRGAAWFQYARDFRMLPLYRAALTDGDPGAAWFRHLLAEAERSKAAELPFLWQQGNRWTKPQENGIPTQALEPNWRFVDPVLLFDNAATRRPLWQSNADAADLLSGGRAVSENLQLDRDLLVRDAPRGEATKKLADIRGIEIREFDWAPHIRGLRPDADPLATLVPADQHAVFFPDAAAAVAVLREIDRTGLAAFNLASVRSTDDRIAERIKLQLGIPIAELGALLPPALVSGVALTGSDLYFDTGTDVAVLLSTGQPAVVSKLLTASWSTLRQQHGAAEGTETVAGINCRTLKSPDRRVCVLLAEMSGAVVLANSPAQVRRLVDAQAGRTPALGSLAEYTFFRDRYRRGEADETAFVLLSDAAIRRWCGPRWRIGHHRRLATGALLAEAQAAHLPAMLAAKESRTIDQLGLGPLEISPRGVRSLAYGTRLFQTPIAETEIDTVTAGEAEAYGRWRDTYQQNWSQFFDPIAVRLTVKPDRLAMDLTAMPLILNSNYREWADWSTGAKLAPEAGDRHPEALVQLVVGLNRDSEGFKDRVEALERLLEPKASISRWLGDWITIYADDDPLWEEFAKSKVSEGQFWASKNYAIPVAVGVAVRDQAAFELFLKSVKKMIDPLEPSFLTRQTMKHHGIEYLGLRGVDGNFAAKTQVYSLALPERWIVSPNEWVIKRAIDRHVARKEGTAPAPAPVVWLGDSVALTANPRALHHLRSFWGNSGVASMQRACWANLPILNEWHRLAPTVDPAEFHAKWWGERLLCPAGGNYVWNAVDGTMESSVLGHPGRPKVPATAMPAALSMIRDARMGVTFQMGGIRARVELKRKN